MIRAPREPGAYRNRDLDCQEAVEPEFLKHAFAETAFIDVETVRKSIGSTAVLSGWSETEVEAALIELGRCYARQVKTIRAASDFRWTSFAVN